ncbi:hypothetical protein MAR_004258 [Mya arenaria]|uniref:Uncharacterized protein n=1 Tax=Mya arenaria TaxID=6604 RepID=A0ABY7F079_MYAAR|nr:hypothetical protein MAR_004258 [Mya arenaria]
MYEMMRTALLILVTCTGTAVNATVCGITQINANTEICCGSLPQEGSEADTSLDVFKVRIKREIFNKTEKVACGDGLELITSVEEIYTKDFICCFGQFHIKENDDGLIIAKPGPGQYFCQDNGVYNSYLMQLIRLKNGSNVVIQKDIKLCGSDTPYILKAEECCENKVINRSKELCCKNSIVTKTHPSYYGCCNINHAWTTYNEFDPPKECLLTHIRKTLRNNPTKTGSSSEGNQNTESKTTERSPLEECPFTECFDREQKQRSTCKKFFELDLYLDDVNFTDDGSNLNVTIIQPDEFVNKKVTIVLLYICPCLDSGNVYTLFTNKGWVRKLTIDGNLEFTKFQTIKKNDFLVRRGSGEDKFKCTIRRKYSAFYNSWRASPVR